MSVPLRAHCFALFEWLTAIENGVTRVEIQQSDLVAPPTYWYQGLSGIDRPMLGVAQWTAGLASVHKGAAAKAWHGHVRNAGMPWMKYSVRGGHYNTLCRSRTRSDTVLAGMVVRLGSAIQIYLRCFLLNRLQQSLPSTSLSPPPLRFAMEKLVNSLRNKLITMLFHVQCERLGIGDLALGIKTISSINYDRIKKRVLSDLHTS